VNEKKTVTVTGVPVTIAGAGRELAVQAGRFDPQAAAGEGGPRGTGERWAAGLYPAAPGAAEQLLLVRRLLPGRHRPARRVPRRLQARRP
jgi:hypothetical protein